MSEPGSPQTGDGRVVDLVRNLPDACHRRVRQELRTLDIVPDAPVEWTDGAVHAMVGRRSLLGVTCDVDVRLTDDASAILVLATPLAGQDWDLGTTLSIGRPPPVANGFPAVGVKFPPGSVDPSSISLAGASAPDAPPVWVFWWAAAPERDARRSAWNALTSAAPRPGTAGVGRATLLDQLQNLASEVDGDLTDGLHMWGYLADAELLVGVAELLGLGSLVDGAFQLSIVERGAREIVIARSIPGEHDLGAARLRDVVVRVSAPLGGLPAPAAVSVAGTLDLGGGRLLELDAMVDSSDVVAASAVLTGGGEAPVDLGALGFDHVSWAGSGRVELSRRRRAVTRLELLASISDATMLRHPFEVVVEDARAIVVVDDPAGDAPRLAVDLVGRARIASLSVDVSANMPNGAIELAVGTASDATIAEALTAFGVGAEVVAALPAGLTLETCSIEHHLSQRSTQATLAVAGRWTVVEGIDLENLRLTVQHGVSTEVIASGAALLSGSGIRIELEAGYRDDGWLFIGSTPGPIGVGEMLADLAATFADDEQVPAVLRRFEVADVTVTFRTSGGVLDASASCRARLAVSGDGSAASGDGTTPALALRVGLRRDGNRTDITFSGSYRASGGARLALAELAPSIAPAGVTLPPLDIGHLALEIVDDDQRFEVELAGEWEIINGIALHALGARFTRGPAGASVVISGATSIGGVPFTISGVHAPASGWRFEGTTKEGASVHLAPVIADLSGRTVDQLPPALAGLRVDQLRIAAEPAAEILELDAAATMPTPSGWGDLSVTVRIAIERRPDGTSRHTASGSIDLAGLDLGGLVNAILDDLGLPDGARVPAGLLVDSATVAFDGDLQLTFVGRAGRADVRIDLWRRGSSWVPLVQVAGVGLPATIPIPASVAAMVERTTLRVATARLDGVDLLGGGIGTVGGTSLLTELPFHATPIGELLELGEAWIPIELTPGAAEISFRHDLLPDGEPIDLEAFELNRLLVGFSTPATVEVQLGCDVHFELDSTSVDLRFMGGVTADLTKRNVTLAVAFAGRIDHTGAVVDWDEPFGFPGLTIGTLELWVGSGLRALRGSLRVGRASIDVEAIWEVSDPARTAVRFEALSLTCQELLDGFLGDDAPTLPAPLGESGFEELRLDYAASTFPFMWLTEPRLYEQGLRGSARLNLLGLQFAASFDLQERRLAASMERVEVGSLLLIDAPASATDLPDWADDSAGLGGPWLVLDLGDEPVGAVSARMRFLGFTKSVAGTYDGRRLELVLIERIEGPILTWSTNLTVAFGEVAGSWRAAVSGSLDTRLTINPDELLDRFLGTDTSLLPDINLVDLGLSLAASLEVRSDGVSGSFAGEFVAWDERLTFSLSATIELDFDSLGSLVADAATDAAAEVLNFFGAIGEAIEAAVAAVVEVLEDLGEAIGEVFGEIERLANEVSRAFEELGRVIEALAEAIGDEISSWFGDDSGKQQRERERLAAERRHRELAAQAAASRERARRIDEERRLLLLDVVDNLADGAIRVPEDAAAIERRIAECEHTGVNPFTRAPEWDRTASRARWQAVWSDALGRARERSTLRNRYMAALDAAVAGLAAVEARAEAARDTLTDVSGASEAAATKLEQLLGQQRKIAAAHSGALDVVRLAREGAVKVEVGLYELDRVKSQVDADRDELSAGHVRLAGLIRDARQLLTTFDSAVTSRLGTRLAAAVRDAETARAEVAAAERALVEAEAEVELYRSCRRTLTLARLDAVQRSAGRRLTGDEAFKAWVEAARGAGGSARVNLTTLRGPAEALLRRLPGLWVDTASAIDDELDELDGPGRSGPGGEPVSPTAPDGQLLDPGAALAALDGRRAIDDPSTLDLVARASIVDGYSRPAVLASRAVATALPGAREWPSRGAIQFPDGGFSEWARRVSLARTIAEAIRRSEPIAITAEVEQLVIAWRRWRDERAHLAEAALRVETNALLAQRTRELRDETLRAEFKRVLVALRARNELEDRHVWVARGTEYRETEGWGWKTKTTTYDEWFKVKVQRWNDAFVTAEWLGLVVFGGRPVYEFPLHRLLAIEKWNVVTGLSRYFAGWPKDIEAALDDAIGVLESLVSSSTASARADAEVTSLASTVTANSADVSAAFRDHLRATGDEAFALLEPVLWAGRALTALDGETGLQLLEHGGPSSALNDGSGAAGTLAGVAHLDAARAIAHASAFDGEITPEVVGSVEAWSTAIRRHAAGVDETFAQLHAIATVLDGHRPGVLARWRAATLDVIAAAVIARAAPSRERVARALTTTGRRADGTTTARRAAATATIGEQGDETTTGDRQDGVKTAADVLAAAHTYVEDTSGLFPGIDTDQLRDQLGKQRSELDDALKSIDELVVSDIDSVYRNVHRLEVRLAGAAETLEALSDLLDGVRDVAQTLDASEGPGSIAGLEALRLTVAVSRDERVLRGAVERGAAAMSEIEAVGRRLDGFDTRVAAVAEGIAAFERELPAVRESITAVAAEFDDLAAQAEEIKRGLAPLFTAVVEALETVRARHRAVLRTHGDLFAALAELGLWTGRLAVERVAITALPISSASAVGASLAPFDPDTALEALHDAAKSLARHDGELHEAAAAHHRAVLARAAELWLRDPSAAAEMERIRRALDDASRRAIDRPPEALLARPVDALPAVIRSGRPIAPRSTAGSSLRASGITVALRIDARRARRNVLLDGVLVISVAGEELRATVPGSDEPMRVSLGATDVADVAVVVEPSGFTTIWVDGLPRRHLRAPAPADVVTLLGPAGARIGEEDSQVTSGVSDFRVWTRTLRPNEVCEAAIHVPDPAAADLERHRLRRVIPGLAELSSARGGVPDGAALVETTEGDVVVTDVLELVPGDALAVRLGAGAAAQLHGAPRLAGPRTEIDVDLDDPHAASGVRSLRVVPSTTLVEAGRWVLEARSGDRARILDVVPEASGALRPASGASLGTGFELARAEVEDDSPTALPIIVRSGFNGATLRLDGLPRCEIAELGTSPGVGAGDRLIGADDDGGDWLADRQSGLLLLGDEPPERITMTVEVDDADVPFTLLSWTVAGGRRRLVILQQRCYLLSARFEILDISVRLHSGDVVEITVTSAGADGAADIDATDTIHLRDAPMDKRRADEQLCDLMLGDDKVGRIHELMVDWSDSRRELDLPERARARVGPAPDALHHRLGAPFVGGVLHGASPTMVDGDVAVAGWVRLRPRHTVNGWNAIQLIDEHDRCILRFGSDAMGRRQVVEVSGGEHRLTSRVGVDRWSHVVLSIARVRADVSELRLRVDGEDRLTLEVPHVLGGLVRLVAGSPHADVDDVVMWTGGVDQVALDRHFLLPSVPEIGHPISSWRVDVDRAVVGDRGIPAVRELDGRPAVVESAPHGADDRLAVHLTERVVAADDTVLMAHVTGERYGRPSFVLGQNVGGATEWLALGSDGSLTTTNRRSGAAEIALRAVLIDPVDPDERTSWFRAYGGPGEDPAEVSRALDIPPGTAAIVRRERSWCEALRVGIVRRTVGALDWLLASAQAVDVARASLSGAWIQLDLPAGDPSAAAERVDALTRQLDALPDEGVGRVDVRATRDVQVVLGRPSATARLDRWAARLAAASRADDPIEVLLGEPSARTADVIAWIHDNGLWPTAEALDWELRTWRAAIGAWATLHPGLSAREVHDRFAVCGLEVRTTGAVTPAEAVERLRASRSVDVIEVLDGADWRAVDPTADVLHLVEGLDLGPITDALDAERALRGAGLEPRWAPMVNIKKARRVALERAADALRRVGRYETPFGEVEQMMELDLLLWGASGVAAPDNWVVEARRAGITTAQGARS